MKLKKLVILSSLILVGCGSNKPTPSPIPSADPNISVASPKGAPAFALYDRLFDSNVEINNPDNVQTWLTTGSFDAVIAPTNAGVALINAGKANYKIAATITFGNFFIAATGNDDNGIMDKDDYVTVFQKNGIPDKLFQYLYGSEYNVHYITDNTVAVRTLTTGTNEKDSGAKVDYVLIAQPGLMNALKNNPNAYEYANLQDEFRRKAGNALFTQASIFINNDCDASRARAFLDKIENNVNSILEDYTLVENALSDYEDVQVAAKLSIQKAAIKPVLSQNLLGLGYRKAFDIKNSIDKFLTNLNLGNETSEEIYFK